MQTNYDEWADDGLPTGKPSSKRGGKGKSDYTGQLNVSMTLSCLIAVTTVSFLIAWLFRNTVRSFWEMGLTFAVPFAALMGASLVTERATGKMTPQCSRNAQTICALVTVITAFIIGSLADGLHQPVIVEKIEPEYDYLIVMDKSGSMVFSDLDEPSRKALHELIDGMEEENKIGIVAFGSEVIGSQDILPLDKEQRKKISDVIDIPIKTWIETDEYTGGKYTAGDGTDFSVAMENAQSLIEHMPERNKDIRIILVTDGDDQSDGNFIKFSSWASQINSQSADKQRIELSAIQLGDIPMLQMVKEAVSKTGGTIYDNVKTADLARQLQSLKNTIVTPEPVDTLKATYAGKTADGKPNTPYMILTCVLLILQGVLSGFALKIMFSVQGQFRFQTILSPLMGLGAFLLLNFGRYIGIAPAWLCEGIAFSAFGLVFMRENLNTGRNVTVTSNSQKGKKTKVSPVSTGIPDEDF